MKNNNKSEKKVKNKGGNGSGSGPAPAPAPAHYFLPEPSIPKERPKSEVPVQVGVAADASLPWLKALWEFAAQRPVERGSYRCNDEDVKSLLAKATAEAKANAPLPWEPEKNAHDAQLVRSRNKLEEEEVEGKRKNDDDLGLLEEFERERANFYRNAPKPSKPIISIILATLFLALSLAPSFLDGFFYRIDDEQLAWLISGILGLVAAGCISYLILGEYRHAPNTRINLRLVGSFAICGGLAAMRYWSGQGSSQGTILTVALLLIELGLIIFLERIAQSLRAEHIYYLRCKEESDRLDALWETYKLRAERSGVILDNIRAKIAEIDEHIKDRISKAGQIGNLIDLAVKTVMDGYNHGRAIMERRKTRPWRFVDDGRDDDPDQEA